MFTPLSPLSTRILTLSGFPPQLKTRDIQAVFSQWEADHGGFKIKWVDDTNAMVIFQDPGTAKRAYLATLMSPPPLLMTSQGITAKVRPYNGDDAASIIASVEHRTRSRSIANGAGFGANNSGGTDGGNASRDEQQYSATSPATAASLSTASPSTGHASASPSKPGHRASISTSSSGPLDALGRRRPSIPASAASSLPPKPVAAAMFDAAQGGPSPARHLANAAAAERAAQAELAQQKVKAVEVAVQEEIEELREAQEEEKGKAEVAKEASSGNVEEDVKKMSAAEQGAVAT